MPVIREENQYMSLVEEGDGNWRVTVIYPPFAEDIAYQVMEIADKHGDDLERKFWIRKNLLIPTKMIFNNYQDAKEFYDLYSRFSGGFGEDENKAEKVLTDIFNLLRRLKSEGRLVKSVFMDVYNTQTEGLCEYMNFPNDTVIASNIAGASNTVDDKAADFAHEEGHRINKERLVTGVPYWRREFDAIEEQIRLLVLSYPNAYTLGARRRTLQMIENVMAYSRESYADDYDFEKKTAEEILEDMEERVGTLTNLENLLSDYDEEETRRINVELNPEGEEWHQRMEARGWIDADVEDAEDKVDESQFVSVNNPIFWEKSNR